MKRVAVLLGVVFLTLVPFAASAQTATANNTALLTELQTLENEVSSLESTLETLIASVIGAPVPTTSSTSTPAGLSISPTITLPQISSTPNYAASGDITSQLMQALAPTVSGTTTFAVPPPVTTTAANQPSASVNTPPSQVANQMDPACISTIFANGAQCGGLYWCGSGANGNWSSQACTDN